MESQGSRPLTVLWCGEDDGYDDDVRRMLAACGDAPVHFVGVRPKKAIDPLLAGADRVLVIGDDADLNAVVLRLLRKDLLSAVEVAYAPPHATAVTRLHSLPVGVAAVDAAGAAPAVEVTLVRNDAGGVLVGAAHLTPVVGAVYVDQHRVLGGSASEVSVVPHPDKGVAVTVTQRRRFGLGRRSVTTTGRAVEFGLGAASQIMFDEIEHPRTVNRWVFYKHTAPLRLVRPTA